MKKYVVLHAVCVSIIVSLVIAPTSAIGLVLAMATAAPAREPEAQKILKGSGVKGGLIVVIGCDDPELLVGLRLGDSYLVHGLDTDGRKVAAARKHIRSRDVYGSVSVDVFDGKTLPYIDNVVNLLVIRDAGAEMGGKEIQRVLAPRGAALFGEKFAARGSLPGARSAVEMKGRLIYTKPTPPEIDDWTHYLHAPDNNAVANDTVVGPPRHLQWVGSPRWTRDHNILNSVSSAVTVGGRLFFVLDDATGLLTNAPGQWVLVARDAFNGVELWRKAMSSWAQHSIRFRSGPPQLPRLLVASEEHVYAPLGLSAPVSQMDAKSGKVLKTFDATKGAEEILLIDKTLLVLRSDPVAEHAYGHGAFTDIYKQPRKKAIAAVDTASGKLVWRADLAGGVRAETLACDAGKVFIQIDNRVVCFDKATGKERWAYGSGGKAAREKTTTPPSKRKGRRGSAGVGFGKYVLVVSDGVVLCNLTEGLTAISVKDGKKLWSSEGGQGFHAPLDLFVINGVVWTGNHPSDSTAPPPVHDFSVARDLHTGKIKSRNSVMVDLQSAGHHHRCYRNKATSNYIISGKRGVEMFNVTGDNHSRNNWIRGTCQYGVMPANGLIYAPPNSCGCYPESLLRGFYAMASQRSEVKPQQSERLVKGPAYGKAQRPTHKDGQPSSSWTTFRADARRRGVVATKLSDKPTKSWTAPIGGRLSQPVVAAGTLVVSCVDRHTVYAFDAKRGKQLWSRTVGGRVDSPPTIYESLCLFGSADGSVYCLRLSDGELVWRFLAAPADRRTVVWGQIESVWPVHGSVLVMNGVAYASAGRSTWFDHGIDLYGLDPETGKLLHRHHYESPPPQFRKGKDQAEAIKAKADADKARVLKQTSRGSSRADYKTFLQSDKSRSFTMAGGTISDVLVGDGDDVYLHQVRFSGELKKQDTPARHLLSSSGFLHDPIESRRSSWVLGDGDFSMYPMPYIKYIGSRSGKNPVGGATLAYDAENAWSLLRSAGLVASAITADGSKQKWQAKTGMSVPRAVLKAGKHVVVCGMAGDKGVAGFHSSDTGKKTGAINLAAPPVWDGMAAADGRLYVSLEDGRVVCYE